MPPTNPWGKKPIQDNTSQSGFPELNPKTPTDAAPKSKYEEIQEDELIALAAIYGEDFKQIQTNQGAWKVRTSYDWWEQSLILGFRKQSHLLKFASSHLMKT